LNFGEMAKVDSLCALWKYEDQADIWLLLALIAPAAAEQRIKSKTYDYRWKYDGEMEDQGKRRTGRERSQGAWSRVGRNDPCYCGSGKKFK
jgi:uncharacterized protein YecA (UPF0149 family)